MSNYFDNDRVQGLIEEYLDYPPEGRKENIELSELRKEILGEIGKIINGIIFTHKFTIWELYDDLYQEATEACIKALEKFNPNYITSSGERATAFNYFSLTAKRCLKFYTIKNKPNRENFQIDEYSCNLQHNDNTFSNRIVIENFVKELKQIFISKKRQKFYPLIDILDDYLKKMQLFNKRDFFRFAKFHGWSPNLIRKFLKIIGENKDDIFNTMKSDKTD